MNYGKHVIVVVLGSLKKCLALSWLIGSAKNVTLDNMVNFSYGF